MCEEKEIATKIKVVSSNNIFRPNLVTKCKAKLTSKTRTRDKRECRKQNTLRFVHLVRPNNELRLEERDLSTSLSMSFS